MIKLAPGSLVRTENEGFSHQQVAWVTRVADHHPRKIWRCISSNVMPVADCGWMWTCYQQVPPKTQEMTFSYTEKYEHATIYNDMSDY